MMKILLDPIYTFLLWGRSWDKKKISQACFMKCLYHPLDLYVKEKKKLLWHDDRTFAKRKDSIDIFHLNLDSNLCQVNETSDVE